VQNLLSVVEIVDAASSLHFSSKIVQEFGETAAKRSSKLAQVDATSCNWTVDAETISGESRTLDFAGDMLSPLWLKWFVSSRVSAAE